MMSRLARWSVLVPSAVLAACAAGGPSGGATLGPTPAVTASAWTRAQAQVGQDVLANRYAAADRVLADFQQSHATAPEMVDAIYYRALYKLDPANAAAAPREAAALLDTLLASPISSSHRSEAHVLRRIATTLEARASAPAAPAVTQAPARAEDTHGKDEEIVRLREELTKANAELERVKRRVATPKP